MVRKRRPYEHSSYYTSPPARHTYSDTEWHFEGQTRGGYYRWRRTSDGELQYTKNPHPPGASGKDEDDRGLSTMPYYADLEMNPEGGMNVRVHNVNVHGDDVLIPVPEGEDEYDFLTEFQRLTPQEQDEIIAERLAERDPDLLEEPTHWEPDVWGEPEGWEPSETVEEARRKFDELEMVEGTVEGLEQYGVHQMNQLNRALYRLKSMGLPPIPELKIDDASTSDKGFSGMAGHRDISLNYTDSSRDYEAEYKNASSHWYRTRRDALRNEYLEVKEKIEELERRREEEGLNYAEARNLKDHRHTLSRIRRALHRQADRPHAAFNLESTLIHEYGHIFENLLNDAFPVEFRHDARHKVFNISRSESRHSTGARNKRSGFKSRQALTAKGRRLAKRISEYAMVNDAEYIAEAFTCYAGGHYHRLEPKVKRFFDDVTAALNGAGLYEKEYPYGKVLDLDLTDDQKEEMRRLFEKGWGR